MTTNLLKYKLTGLCFFALSSAVLAQNAPAKQRSQVDDETKKDSLEVWVPVAYGVQKQKNITGSISTVFNEQFEKTSVTMLSNSLFGLLPGLIINEKSGEIGSYSNELFIRGKSTFGSTAGPLVFIDGFERNINDITPQDVASVSVLKDAAASAMYGIRGANGAILITTKRGTEGKMKISGMVESGLQRPSRLPSFTSSADYASLYNQALSNDGLPLRYTNEDIAGYAAGHSVYYPDNKWEKELVGDRALMTNTNLSAHGGNRTAKYYVSLGYLKNEGIFRNTDFDERYSTNSNLDRFNFRTNMDIKAFENLDVNIDISGQINRRNMPKNSTAEIWNMLYRYPQNEFPMLLDGDLLGGTAAFTQNPEGYLNRSGYRRMHDRFYQTGIGAKYNFQGAIKGLAAGLRFGYDNTFATVESFSRTFASYEITGKNPDGTPILNMRGTDGKLGFGVSSNAQARQTSFEGYLSFDRSLKGGHDFKSIILYHQDRLIINQNNANNVQFVSARANYAYKDKYLAEAILSYSGSEAFAKGERFNLYPAASFGWILSNEDFLNQSKNLNFLKLRMSAGVLGNSSVGSRFTYREQYTTSSNAYYFGTGIQANSGTSESTLANPLLRPEKSAKFDVGLDATLFNHLSVSATAFYEIRSDILTAQGNIVPLIIGASLPSINAGKATTRGLEFAALWQKEFNSGWSTGFGLNATYYNNTINNIYEQPLPLGSEYQYKKGHAIGANLGLQAIGFFQNDNDIANSPVQQFGPVKPGDIKYKDVNGDNLINDYDRIYLDGHPIPNLDLGFNMSVGYKGFDLSTILSAQLGSDIYLGDSQFLFWPLYNSSYRITQYVADRNPWTPSNSDIANYPRLTTMENANNYRRSDFWMLKGDRFRIRKLELGYTIPSHISAKAAMSSLRIYVRAMNLFTADHLGFADPVALGSNPLMRSYHLGLNVNF